jgi:hypothetical protein
MSKRVRYDGAGEVIVAWPPGAVYPEKTWTVAPNHWLPDDAPAALRDELADRDDWTVIDAPATTSKGGDD